MNHFRIPHAPDADFQRAAFLIGVLLAVGAVVNLIGAVVWSLS